jgi:hypothetical protein
MKGVLPMTLLCGSLGLALLLPARWIGHRHLSLLLKVVSSWLLAITALLAILQCLPVTPGYLPDHVE